MDNPLMVSAMVFILAAGTGLWSQRCLSPLSDCRNILFIMCTFLGIGAAGACLFNLVYLLFTGRFAQADVQMAGTIVTLIALWKALNAVIGKLNNVLQKKSE